MSEEQLSMSTLSKSVVGCRHVSQHEFIQDVNHTSTRSQFEELAFESVDKAFGPSLFLGVVRVATECD
jgi:hypothetical protein